MNKYKVVRDGELWGVVDETGTYINDAPMSKQDAQKLAQECKYPDDGGYHSYQEGYAYACGYYD